MLVLIAFTFYIGQPIGASVLGAGTIIAVVGRRLFLGALVKQQE